MTVLQQEIPIPSRHCDHALFGGSGNLPFWLADWCYERGIAALVVYDYLSGFLGIGGIIHCATIRSAVRNDGIVDRNFPFNPVIGNQFFLFEKN